MVKIIAVTLSNSQIIKAGLRQIEIKNILTKNYTQDKREEKRKKERKKERKGQRKKRERNKEKIKRNKAKRLNKVAKTWYGSPWSGQLQLSCCMG